MNTVKRFVGLILLVVCVNANANETERDSSRDVATKSAVKQTLDVERISPTQVFCMKQKRIGSHVSRNVCQTLAAWKQELDEKAIRSQHLIRPSGKRGWDTDW